MQRLPVALVAALCLVPFDSGGAQSVSDSDFLWVEPLVTVIPDGTRDTSFKVAIMIHSKRKIGDILIPLFFAGHPKLRIDTTVLSAPDIRGVTYGPAGRHRDWTIKTSLVNNDQQSIVLWFFNFADGAEPKNDTLCYLHFILDGSGQAGSVTLDSAAMDVVGPLVGMRFNDPSAITHIPSWTPGVISIFASGDVDCNGEITLADIIYMVNFMFRKGPAPMSGCQ